MDSFDIFSPNDRDGYKRNYIEAEDDNSVATIDISNQLLVDSETKINATDACLIELSEDGSSNEDRLTLAYERLTEIPKAIVDRFADHVRTLDISHNQISNLDALVFFKKLTSLIADDNPISEHCELPPMPTLQLLWLNHCRVHSLFPWIRKVKEACPNLKYLCLMGNQAAPSYLNGGTFYEYLQYRLFVISQFPELVHLDDRAVTEDQRKESQRMYKKPFLERFLPVIDKHNATLTSMKESFYLKLMSEKNRKARLSSRNLLI